MAKYSHKKEQKGTKARSICAFHEALYFNKDTQAVRICTLDATDDSADWESSNEPASLATFLNANDANAWPAADRVVERRIITRQRIWTTQRHKDVFSVRRNIQ